jgi:hypothetical protein
VIEAVSERDFYIIGTIGCHWYVRGLLIVSDGESVKVKQEWMNVKNVMFMMENNSNLFALEVL